jgi:large subunit ribosomal protein L10
LRREETGVNREQKTAVVSELQERFARANLTLVATNRGLSVGEATRLRRKLRAVNGEYKVAKLTLIRRVLPDTPMAGLSRFLDGPRGLVFGYADPIEVAKTLVEFAEQNKRLEIEGGALEGQIIVAEQVKALASMPGIAGLRAQTVGLVQAPARRLASTIMAPAARVAGAISALVKKLEESGTAS